VSAFCKSCGHDDGCAHEPGPGTSIESIIRDYTVGAKRDCYVGGRKIELAERARAELDALAAEVERLQADLNQERADNSLLRAKLAETRGERDDALAKFDAVAADAGMLVKMAAEYEEAAAKVARYEAPGPALLEDDNDLECPLCEQNPALDSEPHDHFQAVDCMRAGAKQQHARCVAAVERAIASAEQEIVDAKKDARAAIDNNAPRYERDECEARQHAASGFLAGVRACLAALKDGAK